MARERSPNRDKAKEMYLNSNGDIKLKDIAEALGVLDTQIRKWKSTDKWDSELKVTLPNGKRNVTNKKVSNDNEISWVDIENEYVTDIRKKPCRLKDLANKYNIDYDYLRRYAAENEWSNKREEFITSTSQKIKEKSSEIISDDIVKYKIKHLTISDKVLDEVNKALDNPHELYTVVEKLRQGYGAGEFKEEIATEVLDVINDSKVVNIVNVLDKLQKMQRQTLGILDAKDVKEEKEVEVDSKPFELPARLIAPPFAATVFDIEDKAHKEYILYGGRGSTKSSFVGLEIINLIKKNPNMHALACRKIENTLRDSVYNQIKWAISALELDDEFNCKLSPLEIKYIPTGQRIYFRGCDDPTKIKSIKPPFGYIGILWFNLRNSDHIKPFKFGETLTA